MQYEQLCTFWTVHSIHNAENPIPELLGPRSRAASGRRWLQREHLCTFWTVQSFWTVQPIYTAGNAIPEQLRSSLSFVPRADSAPRAFARSGLSDHIDHFSGIPSVYSFDTAGSGIRSRQVAAGSVRFGADSANEHVCTFWTVQSVDPPEALSASQRRHTRHDPRVWVQPSRGAPAPKPTARPASCSH